MRAHRAILTYVPKTNRLKVYETGSGDLEDMFDNFVESKALFAYARVKLG